MNQTEELTALSFFAQLDEVGLPRPEREWQFCEGRKWRFDYAWPQSKIAVESEGGVWANGRHNRGKGFIADLEKYNNAALLGWLTLRFTPEQIASGWAVNFVAEALKQRREE